RSARERFEQEQSEFARTLQKLVQEREQQERAVHEARRQVVVLEEMAILQEVGIYEYHHPLENAEAYKVRLADLRRRTKDMAKVGGGAIEAATDWQVNGSRAQGKRMISQTSKLMLRAFNSEVDSVLRAMKPHRLSASVDRVLKAANTIEKRGTMMSIRISADYLNLRVEELTLTADYLAKKDEEKEANRAARAALREQRRVEREMAA